jgi:ribosomal protein L12E/L44/L45/RPP1/RPP2
MNIKHTLVAALLLGTAMAQAQTSPYAGEQARSIKALSDKEVDDLLSGQGMGLAKAAELNGYPGPAHVLELSEPLGLSAEQTEATRQLMQRHKATARAMGTRLIDAERALDQAFHARRIDEQRLAELTAAIGRQQAELRAEHLATHLAQTALLTPQQIERYSVLRGYSGAAPAAHRQHKHH